jgi:2-polyprenyl-3-methyl-5-hydroxy-6-metoxy-1,4-benzoquinol methylase
MQSAEHKTTVCPVCKTSQSRFVLRAIDHSVSGESFEIWACPQCTLRYTYDAPDSSSISRYYRSDAYISHSNTRRGLVNRLYHFVRRRTLHSKYKLLSEFTRKKTGTHLDIGAGTGAFVRYMHENGWQSTGLEPDEAARLNALQCHQANLLDAAELYRLPEMHFDAITLWHVLEHVHELYPYLLQIKKILKPDGRIFIALPNYTSYDAAFYQENWAAYDVPRHLYHFSPASIRYLLHAAGLKLQAIRPMWYDSFYISLLSEKYKSGRSRLLRGFCMGAVSDMKALDDREKCSSLIYVVRK